jgi:hypothetical protein
MEITELWQILLALGAGLTTIAGGWAVLLKILKKLFNLDEIKKSVETVKTLEQNYTTNHQRIETNYQNIINLQSRNDAQDIVLKNLSDSMQSLLRSELIRLYRIHEQAGSLKIIDRECFVELYKNYKKLSGNGMVDSLYKDVQNLPTKIVN